MSQTIYLTPKGKRWVDEIRVLIALGLDPKRAAEIVLRKEKVFRHGEPEQQRIASVRVFAALAAMDAEIVEVRFPQRQYSALQVGENREERSDE